MSKVVHIITRFVNGGADENTLLTCNHQAEAGHEVRLLHGPECTSRMLAMLDRRVEVVRIASLVREVSPGKDVAAVIGIARLLRRVRPDIVHTHTSKAGFVGRLAALASPGAKVVHGVHILPFNDQPLIKRYVYLALEKIAALRTDAFIDVSEGMRDLCLENGLGRLENHHVIRSGMDVAKFRHAAPAADILCIGGEAAGAILIGYVAVLERRKRHRELLGSIAPLLRRHGHVHLVLAGDGPERPELESLTKEAAISAQVHFLGFRDDVDAVLAGCHVGVFVSEREGLPRSLVQYAIAGKPIVATRLPGIDRVLRDGFNGYVVAPDAFDDFAARLESLIADSDLRGTMAGKSRELDLSDWDAEKMVSRIDAVYAQLLSVRTRPTPRIDANEGRRDFT